MITMQMQKKKKTTNTKKQKNKKKMRIKTICQNIWATSMTNCLKKYSNGKNVNSFINEIDRVTYEEDKEKVVKELKDINNIVEHDIEMDEDSKYI